MDGNVADNISVFRFSLDRNRFERCDTAEIHLTYGRNLDHGRIWFDLEEAQRIDVMLQIRDGRVAGGGWTPMFQGILDHVTWHPDLSLVVLECRDYLALLLETRIQQSWMNQTRSELLHAAVTGAGLEAVIKAGPTMEEMSGQFWQVEHKRFSTMARHRFQTAFDVAFHLARESGCDLYADGKKIVCCPIAQAGDSGDDIHDMRSGVVARSFRRDLTTRRGLMVHVASWDSRQRSRTETFFDGEAFFNELPEAAGCLHSFRVPERRMDDVRAIAKGKFQRILAHCREVHVGIPGETSVVPRGFMRVSSPDGAGFEVLSIAAVHTQFSVEHGFFQDVILRKRGV